MDVILFSWMCGFHGMDKSGSTELFPGNRTLRLFLPFSIISDTMMRKLHVIFHMHDPIFSRK